MGCDHENGLNCGHGSIENNADILLDALRSSTLELPNDLSFNVIHTFSMDGLTDPDEEVHLLTDVREPSGRYRDGLLITSGRRATSLLLASSNGQVGHGKIFTENGKASEVGPRPGGRPPTSG